MLTGCHEVRQDKWQLQLCRSCKTIVTLPLLYARTNIAILHVHAHVPHKDLQTQAITNQWQAHHP